MPIIRRIAQDIVKNDWEQILNPSPDCLEEEILKGVVIATAPISIDDWISASRRFIPTIDNWPYATSSAAIGDSMKANPAKHGTSSHLTWVPDGNSR